MIRLLLVIDHLGGGGAQEIAFQLCRRLHQDSIEPTVLSFHSGGLYLQKLQELGVKVHVLLPSKNILLFALLIFRLFRFIRRQDFDVVHTFLPGGLLLTAPITRLRGIPIVHSVLSIRTQPPGWYFPLMQIYQSIVSAYIVIQEQELKDQHVTSGRIKIAEVLMDFEKAYAVHASRKSYRKEPGPRGFIVLSAARLHLDKGHDFAIRAWPNVLTRHPTARLWIAGSGWQETRLRALVRELDLQNSVELLGYQDHLEQAFSMSDLFLRTSLNEGVNLVTLLAMAAGMPIIAFRTIVPKDYITHDYTGWTVPVDERSLADAIILLLDSQNLRKKLGSQAHTSMKSYYDAERIVRYHEQLYRAVHQRQPADMLPSMRDQVWPVYNPFFNVDHADSVNEQSKKHASIPR